MSSLILVTIPVILTGAFAVYNTRLTVRHEHEARQRKEANTAEHSAVMDALNGLTASFQDHLSWHLSEPTTEKEPQT